MRHVDVIRAWKDEEFRNALEEVESASVPDNPAGAVELSDLDLKAILGGEDVWGPEDFSFYYPFCAASWLTYHVCTRKI